MLISFSVGNFLSFKDIQKLELTPDALKEKPANLHIPYFYNQDERLLKAMAIYGHNAHGKSNLIKAYQFFLRFAFHSFSLGKNVSDTGVEPFKLNTSMANKPSHFEVTFLIKETKYRYGFEITAQKVISEWLFYAEAGIRENHVFLRNNQEFEISKSWNKAAAGRPESMIAFAKPSTLLFSVLASQEAVPRIAAIAAWLSGNLVFDESAQEHLLGRATMVYSDLHYRPIIRRFLEAADLGFTTIEEKLEKASAQLERGVLDMLYEQEIGKFELYTKHNLFNEDYKLEKVIEFELLKNESAGSIKFFIIACLLSYAIKNGQLILIDELDSKLHTLLLQMIVEAFQNPKNNTTGSQLIFTTHNTVLLNKKLRRDQYAYVEKNVFGESSICKFHSSKTPIKIERSMEKEYRQGKIGGISQKLSEGSSELFD